MVLVCGAASAHPPAPDAELGTETVHVCWPIDETGALTGLKIEKPLDPDVMRMLNPRERDAATDNKIQLHLALRAHWVLAGIRSGDWGAADSEWVDADRAREHLVAILAFWPESPEANYVRSQLRWDQAEGATAFHHYPHQGPAFLDALE